MAFEGLHLLTLVTLLTLLGSHRGQGQTALMTQNLAPTSDSSNKIQSIPTTYPPTPAYSTGMTIALPVVQSPYPYAMAPSPTIVVTNAPNQKSSTNIPAAQSFGFTRPFTPSRTTAQRSPAQPTTPLTTLSTESVQTSLLQVFVGPTTVLPQGATAPSSTPQHVQISFNDQLSDLGVNDYDMWGIRQSAQTQLAQACMITSDRITDVSIQSNSTGFLVVRFTIQQGYPIYTSEAVQLLQGKIQTPKFMQLSGQQVDPSVVIFWTDDGPCPADCCLNGGLCNVSVSGSYGCQCNAGYAGSKCQELVTPGGRANTALLALLVLLVIPVGVALVVGFVFGRRRQQKQQLKRAFDLRDVRTIGPKSMLSLPQEQGMRNQMYDTRSFAMAFTDTSFSKSSSPPSSEDDLMSHMG